MEYREVIQKRKSVRSFKSDPIPDDVLEEILEAGSCAPSAQNRQPWRYLVINDNQKVRELARNCGLIGLSNFFIKDAPVVIVACAETKSNLRVNSQDYYLVDVAISFQQMILAATNRGIGTCWLAAFSESKLRSYLQIPKSWRIVALSPFGYPAENEKFYPKLVSSFAGSRNRLPREKTIRFLE